MCSAVPVARLSRPLDPMTELLLLRRHFISSYYTTALLKNPGYSADPLEQLRVGVSDRRLMTKRTSKKKRKISFPESILPALKSVSIFTGNLKLVLCIDDNSIVPWLLHRTGTEDFLAI